MTCEISDLRSSIASLEQQNEVLREQKAKLESDNNTAAQFGLQLLEKDTANQNEIEKLKKERSTLIRDQELLREENHSLQKRLEAHVNVEDDLESDIDAAVTECKRKHEKEMQEIRCQFESQCVFHTKKIGDLELELKERERSFERVCGELSKMKREMESSQQKGYLSDDSLEASRERNALDELRSNMACLIVEKEELETELRRCKTECQSLSEAKLELESDNDMQKEQLTELRSSVSEYKSKAENAQVEIALLKTELMGAGGAHSRKGNSMFSELNDQRVKAERQLTDTESRCMKMESDNERQRKEIDRLKNSLATAIQMQAIGGNGNQGDPKSVQDELSRVRGELRVANARLEQQEKRQSTMGYLPKDAADRFAASVAAQPDTVARQMLQQLQQELSSVRSELQSAKFERAACQDQLAKEQRKCSAASEQSRQYQADCARLQMKLSEFEARKLNRKVKTEQIVTLSHNPEVLPKCPEVSPPLQPENVPKDCPKPSRGIKMSPDVIVVQSDGKIDVEAVKENQEPSTLRKELRARGRKVHSGSTAADTKPELDTSVEQCRQQ